MKSIALLVTVLSLTSPRCAGLFTYFNETVASEFLKSARQLDVRSECRRSLHMTSSWTTELQTPPVELRHFYGAFGNGPPRFISEDRWQYNMRLCFKSAHETPYSRSEYPTNYCYGTNEHKDNAFGICLPATCASDALLLLNSWQRISTNDKQADEEINEVMCAESRKKVQWTEQSDVLSELTVNMIALGFVALATIYHSQRGLQSRTVLTKVLEAFSVKKNAKKLFEMPKYPSSTISCLIGLRFLSTLWVVIGHSMAWIQGFLENPDDLRRDMTQGFFNQLVTNHALAVDSFFVISATLTSFTWFAKVTRTEEKAKYFTVKYWLRFYRHRIIRLMPAYLYTLSTVTFKSSTHSFYTEWPPTDPYLQCRKYWWENVLFINSFTNANCLGWTWYISAEFMFFLFSPIFLLSLWKCQLLGFVLSAFTIVISSALTCTHIYSHNYPPTPLPWASHSSGYDYYQQVVEMYIRPQYRIGAYIIGLLLGHHLAKIRGGFKNQMKLSTYFGWTFAVLFGFFAIFGLYPSIMGWSSRIYNAVYGATFRVVWSLCIAWVIYACYTGRGSIINSFLSCKLFLPFSVLTYSVYLIHLVHVISVFQGLDFPIVYHGQLQFIKYIFFSVLLSYFFGSFAAFVAEFPAVNLEKLIFGYREYQENCSQRNGKAHLQIQSFSKENLLTKSTQ